MAISVCHVPPVCSRGAQLMAGRGEGNTLCADDGQAYAGFTSGIGVTHTGHGHPRVVEAIRPQAGIVLHPPLVELGELLRKGTRCQTQGWKERVR